MLARTRAGKETVFRLYNACLAIGFLIAIPWQAAMAHELEDLDDAIDEDTDLLEISATSIVQARWQHDAWCASTSFADAGAWDEIDIDGLSGGELVWVGEFSVHTGQGCARTMGGVGRVYRRYAAYEKPQR